MEAKKITERIILENVFELKKKKPGLSGNRPSNNSAQKSKKGKGVAAWVVHADGKRRRLDRIQERERAFSEKNEKKSVN